MNLTKAFSDRSRDCPFCGWRNWTQLQSDEEHQSVYPVLQNERFRKESSLPSKHKFVATQAYWMSVRLLNRSCDPA